MKAPAISAPLKEDLLFKAETMGVVGKLKKYMEMSI